MRVKVQKWGNSLAIRIPKAYADDLGVGADADVELVQSRGRLVLTPIRRAEYRLSDLVAGITRKNVHGEVDFGPPVGREVLQVAARFVPARGDVVWLTLDPQAGHEQKGRRPSLVLSPRVYNARAGLAIVCPITGRAKGHPFEVAMPPGLPVAGVVLSDQAKNQDWRARRASLACRLPPEAVNDVLAKLRTLLDDHAGR